MVEIKAVLNDPKTGKSYQKVIAEKDARSIYGKKIGDELKGESFGLSGYAFRITGGSDTSGFPMRKEIEGVGKKRILSVEGVGVARKTNKTKKGKMRFHGVRLRKTVAGNTVGEQTAQLNLKITTSGKEPLEAKEEAAPENA